MTHRSFWSETSFSLKKALFYTTYRWGISPPLYQHHYHQHYSKRTPLKRKEIIFCVSLWFFSCQQFSAPLPTNCQHMFMLLKFSEIWDLKSKVLGKDKKIKIKKIKKICNSNLWKEVENLSWLEDLLWGDLVLLTLCKYIKACKHLYISSCVK